MGCFPSHQKKNTLNLQSDKLCEYPRHTKIQVKVRNVAGSVIRTQNVNFVATDPTLVSTKEILLENEKLFISSCVLPGQDPRGEYKKKCQDNCFYLFDANGILCCLFDGHGAQGERVADFCQTIIQKLFERRKKILNVKTK